MLLRGANVDVWSVALYVLTGLPHVPKSPSVGTALLSSGNGTFFPAVFLLAVALRASSALGTHLCTGILVGLSHQVIQGHVLVHRHVAELERKDLASGRRVGKRHIDDPIEATRTHQSLEGEKEKTDSGFKDLIISPLPSNFFGEDLWPGGGGHHESAL